MQNEPLFHIDAYLEFEAATLDYVDINVSLAMDFEAEVEIGLAKIVGQSDGWPFTEDDETRWYLLKRFPFKIIYLPIQEQVAIVAIAHEKRNPGYWRYRLNDSNGFVSREQISKNLDDDPT